MRLFVAFWLSEKTKEALVDAQKVLVKSFPEARVVNPDQLHLTLKFIGETPAEKAEDIKGFLRQQARLFPTFKLVVRGAGVFPDKRAARLLWVGAEGQGWPKKINEVLEEGLEKFGIRQECKFREHITLVRFRVYPAWRELEKLISEWQGIIFGETEVRELTLVESQLKPEGPIYRTVESFFLGEPVAG
ncbi:MAG: RNA 2',3'-cyclic phosphodiesterase [Candidatus Omnitrophica bacterium]|nr:RNA 2',3'-cyclic phosphodiesterase [Candidatus Omnitrophota bacterium]